MLSVKRRQMAALDLELMDIIMETGVRSNRPSSYLLVGENQLVVEDRVTVDQTLYLVGESAEGLYQSLEGVWRIHPMDGAALGTLVGGGFELD